MSEWTEADFDSLSWHDCHIWGIRFVAGDGDTGDWTSDLEIDLDVIVEWICGASGGAEFRVAPGTLTFHGVTDLRIDVDWGSSGHQSALHPVSIHAVERERLTGQKVYLDRPYYRWRIAFNWPAGGTIEFGACGFTQKLRAEPVLIGRQHLTRLERDGR